LSDIKKYLVETADKIVNGSRRSAYGKPENNFRRIARFWEIYFENIGVEMTREGEPFTIQAQDVSPMMRLMKEARLCESPDHLDSFIDLIGYTLTGAEVQGVDVPTEDKAL